MTLSRTWSFEAQTQVDLGPPPSQPPDTVQTPFKQPSVYCLDTIHTASEHHPDTLQTIIHQHPDTVQTPSRQPFWYCLETIQIHHLDTVQTPSRQPSEDFQDTIQTTFKHHSDTFGYLADINRQFGVSDTLPDTFSVKGKQATYSWIGIRLITIILWGNQSFYSWIFILI